MHWKDLEAEKGNCGKISDLKNYAFKFSGTNSLFEINDLRSLFKVTFGPIFLASAKQQFEEL